MKYLIVLLVIAIVIWLARAGKRAEKVKAERATRARAKAVAQDLMVACDQCGVHLPKSDAVASRGRLFCSDAHRAAFERTGVPR